MTEEEKQESLTRQLLEQTQEELAETKDRYLRALADLQNLKRKMSQDRQEAWERGAISIVEEILPILDNFERALKALS
ncbi:MAG: nucleotide exchange factor GrpE, partial [Armatimonadetes bacterium]|nr:nucleotide exchange factor GrpE [Armatimonadota bacterium]NIM23579.1 nucleotide exchange factor GrpE [Armatimonadota bacterium]NIM67445.1 nucleotide exchange factor GrpE [Armatimonadota bacterium]NIM75946.1 nucleotide exchange factor GrpE [Armatimonadota bacterium]NIN05631.1 nucleotide exchange factor GrpE [Armatimonadota bacterium]